LTDSLDALTFQFWKPILVSIVCGAVVGFERQLRGKPLDVRTAVLVCLGTNVYIRLGVVISGEHTDTMRILGQVVTGIGFLGAGAILKLEDEQRIKGLTTAAGIWMTAAVAVAIGLGHLGTAAIGVVLAWIVLAALIRLARGIDGSSESA